MRIEDPRLTALLTGGEWSQKAAELNEKQMKQRTRAAYDYVLSDEKGRAFVGILINACHFYLPCEDEKDEGMRRVALMIRNTAGMLGFLGAFHKAEDEQTAFENAMRERVEQAEKKEKEE